MTLTHCIFCSLHIHSTTIRKLSWHEVYRLCQLRKKYVSAFKEALVVLPPGASKVEKLPVDIQEIEDELTTDVIVMWR